MTATCRSTCRSRRTIAKIYGARRCGYAYRYVEMLMGSDDPQFAADPAERDRLIGQLRSRLG